MDDEEIARLSEAIVTRLSECFNRHLLRVTPKMPENTAEFSLWQDIVGQAIRQFYAESSGETASREVEARRPVLGDRLYYIAHGKEQGYRGDEPLVRGELYSAIVCAMPSPHSPNSVHLTVFPARYHAPAFVPDAKPGEVIGGWHWPSVALR